MWALRKSGVRFRTLIHEDGGGSPGSRRGRCRAVIRLSRDPTRRTWRRGDAATGRRQRWRERQQRVREISNDALLYPSAAVAFRQAQRKA